MLGVKTKPLCVPAIAPSQHPPWALPHPYTGQKVPLKDAAVHTSAHLPPSPLTCSTLEKEEEEGEEQEQDLHG